MIDRNHDLPVKRQAELVGISRGSVYYRPTPVSAADLALMRVIDELHLEYPFAGARMLRDMLRARGFEVGRKHVATLMRRMGIEALYRRPNTSKPHPEHRIYPYLLRGLAIERANQVWAMDLTYIPMARGFVYLAAILDWHSRKVLAWDVSISMEADFCVRCSMPHWRDMAGLRSSTPTRAPSSRARRSPSGSRARASPSAWTAVAAGQTTCSSSACGAA
jgi:putative transposase